MSESDTLSITDWLPIDCVLIVYNLNYAAHLLQFSRIALHLSLVIKTDFFCFFFPLRNYFIYTTHITILNLQYIVYILAILIAYNFYL